MSEYKNKLKNILCDQEITQFDLLWLIEILKRNLNSKYIKFSGNASFSFPRNDIACVDDCSENDCIITVNTLNLLGRTGIMPTYFKEEILQQTINKNPSFKYFLDMFQQRLLQLYHQFWYDQQIQFSSSQMLKNYIKNFSGMWKDAKLQQINYYFSGFYAIFSRPRLALQIILRYCFNIKVIIVDYCGGWQLLPDKLQTQLNKTILGVQNNIKKKFLGNRIWNVTTRFQIHVYIDSFEDFLTWLPNNNKLRLLIRIVTDYVGQEYQFSIKLILKDNQVGFAKLGQGYLSWSAWLNRKNINYKLQMPIFDERQV